MDLTVDIEWAEPGGDELVDYFVKQAQDDAKDDGGQLTGKALDDVKKQAAEKVKKAWDDYYKKHPETKLKRVMSMNYSADLNCIDKDNQRVTVDWDEDIGPDLWLLGDKQSG